MDNLTEKLNTFTSLVLKDASQKRDSMMEEVKREHKERIDEKENEFLTEAYEEIQKTVSDAKKHSNEKVLHEELEAKKRLLLAREKIISRVMSEAENKLKEFTENDEYEAWLTAKTEKALFEVGKGAKTVYISPNDLRFKEKIEQLSDGARLTVEAAQERDFLGGVKVYNTDRKMAVDYSFGEMLSEQKSIFLQNSGLTID